MDNYTSGGIGAILVIALGIAYKIYGAVNHHRIRSVCCGRVLSASIDIESTTPPLKISAPPVDGRRDPNRSLPDPH
jgi:hypothetical protein